MEKLTIHNSHKNELTKIDTSLAKIHGLPKIHKVSYSLLPVVSTINTTDYCIAQLLTKKFIYLQINIFLPRNQELITALN